MRWHGSICIPEFMLLFCVLTSMFLKGVSEQCDWTENTVSTEDTWPKLRDESHPVVEKCEIL